MQLNTSPAFTARMTAYPDAVRDKMNALRTLVHEVAYSLNSVKTLEETLKWGEPSFITKKGSTLRMDWKQKTPNQYAFYFSCSTQLVPTFRVVYGSDLKLEGNRALVFNLEEKLPKPIVKECIRMALEYKELKHLPLLGK